MKNIKIWIKIIVFIDSVDADLGPNGLNELVRDGERGRERFQYATE